MQTVPSSAQRFIIPSLMLMSIVDMMGLSLIFPLMPSLFFGPHPWFGGTAISATQASVDYGLALAAWTLSLLFGAPYLGDLSDQLGRKPVLLWCLLGTALAYALGAMAIDLHWVWLFIGSRLISGFFAGSFEIAQAVVADISQPTRKLRNMTLLNFSISCGMIVGPLLSSLTGTDRWLPFATLATPFWIATGLSVFNVGLLWWLLPTAAAVRRSVHIHFWKVFSAFAFIFLDTRTRLIALVYFCSQLYSGFFAQSVGPILSQRFGDSSITLGLYFAAAGLLSALGFGVQAIMLRYMSVKQFGVSVYSFATLILLVMVLWPVLWVFWVGGALLTMCSFIGFSAVFSILSNAVTPEEQGKTLGGSASAYAAAWVLNGLSVGILLQMALWLPMVIATGIALLTALLMLGVKSRS